MKRNIKKLSILGLAVIFLFSAILCCCFTDAVQAEELALSCHQTAHDTESSESTKECDCDHSLTISKKITFLKDSFVQTFIIHLDQLSSHDYIFARVNPYQAPPLVYDTSPLYVKYSNLRI